MLPYKFISEFILDARVFVDRSCCSAAAMAAAEGVGVPPAAVGVPAVTDDAVAALLTGFDPVDEEPARPLRVELIEISWSN